MTTKAEIDPATHHVRTGAAKTTTSETATPRPAPSVQAVLATQKADQTIDRAGNVVKAEQLPTPLLTDEQRAENLVRNMATIGSQFLTRFDFEGNKGVFEKDGEEYKPGLSVCLIRQTQIGFRRFNGEGNPVDVKVLRLDEGDLYTRDDLDGGYEEEDGQYGRRSRWQEYAILPLIDADGGGELYGFEANKLLVGQKSDWPLLRGSWIGIAGSVLNKQISSSRDVICCIVCP
jgi:hypothetical protein